MSCLVDDMAYKLLHQLDPMRKNYLLYLSKKWKERYITMI